MRENGNLTAGERDRGVDDLIALVGAVNGIVQAQAKADALYFLGCTRAFSDERAAKVEATFLRAYRWQYIVSGVQDERFGQVLGGMISPQQAGRIAAALQPILEA